MQEHSSDVVAFCVVLLLPLAAWVVSRPPLWLRVRARLGPFGVRLWRQLSVPEPPDEDQLRRWAEQRLEQLQHHLERVRRLILDDAWMTATRQVANRLAHEHLVRDVHAAEAAVAVFGPVAAWMVPTGPTLMAVPRFANAAPAPRATVEVIEFGPRGRWV